MSELMLFQVAARLKAEYNRSINGSKFLFPIGPACVYLLYYSSAVVWVLQFELVQIKGLKWDTYAILILPLNRLLLHISMSCFYK